VAPGAILRTAETGGRNVALLLLAGQGRPSWGETGAAKAFSNAALPFPPSARPWTAARAFQAAFGHARSGP